MVVEWILEFLSVSESFVIGDLIFFVLFIVFLRVIVNVFGFFIKDLFILLFLVFI